MADSVQLTDLDVITRFSIAVRTATADRDELITTLRADLAWLERGRPARVAYAADEVYDDSLDEVDEVEEEPVRRAPLRRMPATVRATPRPSVTRAAPAKTVAKKAAAKKTAAKKTTTRRSAR